MYEAYWGLNEPAFSLTPDPRFLFLSRNHESALMMLHYAIANDKGAAMLCGEIGLGKTTVSKKLIEWTDPKNYALAYISNPMLTPLQMLQEFALKLGIDNPSKIRGRLYDQLSDTLQARAIARKKVALVVDEAHLLRKSTAEELRLLLNLEYEGRFVVTLVLLGQLELFGKIEAVPALSQRLSIRALLHPLDLQETSMLLAYRLRVAGFNAELPFTPDAIFEIHKFSSGIPRLVIQAADSMLHLAAVQRLKRIDGYFAHAALTGQVEWGRAA